MEALGKSWSLLGRGCNDADADVSVLEFGPRTARLLS